MPHIDIQFGQIEELKTLLESGTLSETVSKKLRAIIAYYESGSSLDDIAKTAGVTGSALRRWLDQFDPADVQSLEEKSRKPKTLRSSQVDPKIVALIREYRKNTPRIGKEEISTKLLTEHSVETSASAIGRIIERDCLYFADCPLHRRKRFQTLAKHIPVEQEVVLTTAGNIVAVSIPAMTRWTILKKWTVHGLFVAFLLCGTILGLMLTTITRAHAATLGATLLVNSEAFNTIDAGNGSDPIALRFGTSSNSIQFTGGIFRFSAGINAPGTISGTTLNANTLLTGSTLQGFGLYNCQGTSNKITYDSSTKKFKCEADQSGGSGAPEIGTASYSGATLRLGDARYVNKAGDTMTGALRISVSGGNTNTLSFRVSGVMSGANLFITGTGSNPLLSTDTTKPALRIGGSGMLLLGSRSDPASPPPVNTSALFSQNLAGRATTSTREYSPGWSASPVQASLFGNLIMSISTGGGDTVNGYGTTVLSDTTVSHPASDETFGYMTNFATAATNGDEAGTSSSNTAWFRGSTTGANGFFYAARVGVVDTTSITVFSGMADQTIATMVGADSPTGNHIGYQFSTGRGDTNWQFVTKDGTTQNVVNTGVAFTANKVYDILFYCQKQCTSVTWEIRNVTDGTSATGTTSSNLPTTSTALRMVLGVEAETTTAKNIRMQQIYVEADR